MGAYSRPSKSRRRCSTVWGALPLRYTGKRNSRPGEWLLSCSRVMPVSKVGCPVDMAYSTAARRTRSWPRSKPRASLFRASGST